ncbi:unnamed protein product [Trichobilharzia regenti]|nr:unnamed protein product [Trichobilharzia regenti]
MDFIMISHRLEKDVKTSDYWTLSCFVDEKFQTQGKTDVHVLIDLAQSPMSEQIKLVMNTDILIGMHGAAFTPSLFLPSTSCFVELFPGYCCGSNKHFSKSAELRGIQYMAYHGLPESDLTRSLNYLHEH